jgi:hypothetical protein
MSLSVLSFVRLSILSFLRHFGLKEGCGSCVSPSGTVGSLVIRYAEADWYSPFLTVGGWVHFTALADIS